MIKLLDSDPSLSLEKKEEKTKWYQKNNPPFPEDITFFIGAKSEIKKVVEKELEAAAELHPDQREEMEAIVENIKKNKPLPVKMVNKFLNFLGSKLNLFNRGD